MLKEIVFLIADENQIWPARRMKRNFGEDGDMIIIDRVSESSMEDGDIPGGIAPGYDKEEVLFVTDEERILKKLKENGNYVIALLHEGNKEQDLSGASYAVADIEELAPDSLRLAYMRLSGEPWTILQTERCLIRETTVEDVDAFYEIYKEPSITYYMEELFSDPEEEKEYMREYIKKVYGFYGYGLWSIIDRESGRIIGRAGLSWRDGFDIPELGFVIAVPYQHRGYAYEVCTAILKYGKEELRFDKIQALIRKGNESSANLCMRMGFIKEDSVEDGENQYERYIVDL